MSNIGCFREGMFIWLIMFDVIRVLNLNDVFISVLAGEEVEKIKRERKMKSIGMLGGMSWESTMTYYHHLNTIIKNRLGGLNSARIILNSVNFGEVEKYLRCSNWNLIEKKLLKEARRVEDGGADCLLLCTNTMHKIFTQIENQISIPFFHIADALGEKLVSENIKRVGLLGTRFTLFDGFYTQRLMEKFGVQTVTPKEADIKIIDDIIFSELCLGIVQKESRIKYVGIINKLGDMGAESIALACTEIEMLVKPVDSPLPLNDTAYIHAEFAVNWALKYH